MKLRKKWTQEWARRTVAGFLAGYADSSDYKTALQWASAAGNASAFCEGVADGDTIRRYKTQYFAG